MTNTKHTPAPWNIIDGIDNENDPVFVITAGEGQFCPARTFAAFETDKANARLIAAAPELLVGCKDLVHAIEGESTSGRDLAFRKMLAAIRKAEGK